MKIKMLRECIAPQMRTHYCCEICGYIPTQMEPTTLFPGEEYNPEQWDEKIDLRGLTFKIDYDIIEYP